MKSNPIYRMKQVKALETIKGISDYLYWFYVRVLRLTEPWGWTIQKAFNVSLFFK